MKGHIVIKPPLLPLWINCIFKFVPVIRTGIVPHYFTIKHCNVIMLICMAFMIAKQPISTFWATWNHPEVGKKVFTINHGTFSLRYWAGVNQQQLATSVGWLLIFSILVWTRCIMHLVDPPPTRSFTFPTLVHFHLLRPLEPHPKPPPWFMF